MIFGYIDSSTDYLFGFLFFILHIVILRDLISMSDQGLLEDISRTVFLIKNLKIKIIFVFTICSFITYKQIGLNLWKKLLASWGNNISKEISFTDKISQGVINVGNQNSYGDCFIPKSLQAIKSEKLNTEKDFFSSSKTINDLLTANKIGLYGIPGKSNVTLGGAVASDTHGKDNIWGGSFERNIKEIYIQLPK